MMRSTVRRNGRKAIPGSEISGPVALVTGGARRLGAAVCRHLARRGYRVVVNFRSSTQQAADLARAIEAKGGGALAVRADVTRPADVRRMVDRIRRVFGRLDVLVNNVGDYLEKPLSKTSFDDYRRILESNLTAVFLCSQAALPLLRASGRGRIIVIGYAPAGRLSPVARCPVYHTAKTGALLLTKAMAVEEAPRGVTVNMVSPGTLFNSVLKPSTDPRDYIPAGRFCRYQDILGALDYLLGDEASYVTGGHFVISGGYAI
jgi:3-oxoacyl-[acyl-carrier protein] reductase